MLDGRQLINKNLFLTMSNCVLCCWKRKQENKKRKKNQSRRREEKKRERKKIVGDVIIMQSIMRMIRLHRTCDIDITHTIETFGRTCGPLLSHAQ